MKFAEWLMAGVITIPPSSIGQQAFDQVTSHAFLQQLGRDEVYYFISQGVAESLLVHRVEPAFPHGGMVGRVSGSVIVAFELAKDGSVVHPMVVSGPALLRFPVLAAVRQWKFKPYLLRGEPVTVATSVKLTVSNF